MCAAAFFVFINIPKPKAQINVPGIEYLGKGYNIFDKYADPTSVKERILINTDKASISTQRISTKQVDQISGSSLSELSSSYSRKLGLNVNAFIFKVGIETEFSGMVNSSQKQFYSSIIDISSTYKLKYNILPESEIDDLRNLLDPKAKSRLNNPTVSPQSLFEIYGSHYLFNITVGGSARFNTVTNISESASETGIKLAIEAEYKKISGSASNQQSESQKTILQNTSKKLYAIGGNSQYLNDIHDKNAYFNWVNGIESNSVLCGFDANSLRPIWELCADPTRRKEIEKYFYDVYIKKFGMPFNNQNIRNKVLRTDYITSIFQGNFTGKSPNEFITLNKRNGVVLHYGNNLEHSINLIAFNSNLDGVNFTPDKGARILSIDPFGTDDLKFTGNRIVIGDNFGNVNYYQIVADGNAYVAKRFDSNTNTYNVFSLKGKDRRYLIKQEKQLNFMAYDYRTKNWFQKDLTADLQLTSPILLSVAKIGDVNGDNIDDFYLTGFNWHAIIGFDGQNFKVIRKFQRPEKIGAYYNILMSDVAYTVGNLDGHYKDDLIIMGTTQYARLHAGNNTVDVDDCLSLANEIQQLKIPMGSKIIGSMDIDADGKNEIVFANDFNQQRNYFFVDVADKKVKLLHSIAIR